MDNKELEDVDLGAIVADTWIQLTEGSRRLVQNLNTKDMLFTGHETHARIRFIKKRNENQYYELKTAHGKSLKVTAQQCILTKEGWKRAHSLRSGNEVMHYNFHEGRVYDPLISVEKKVDEMAEVYVISLHEKTFIANGFICCDYDIQHGKK